MAVEAAWIEGYFSDRSSRYLSVMSVFCSGMARFGSG
jgi:hypothetical protein